MKKVLYKFSISFALLLNTIIFVFFFEDYVYLLDDYLIPVLFIYFFIDSLSVIIPDLNKDTFSGKHLKKFFKEYPKYNIDKIKKLKQRDDQVALLIFFLYFSGITVIGLSYLCFDWFELKYLYIVFLFINLSDYICILLWCPFRSLFLKNKCCNTCRISNWDRLMKFALLLFIPNFYTISIFIMGFLVFIIWEFSRTVRIEYFYSASNEILRCSNCDLPCTIRKEQP
jgi:hypothetical protein